MRDGRKGINGQRKSKGDAPQQQRGGEAHVSRLSADQNKKTKTTQMLLYSLTISNAEINLGACWSLGRGRYQWFERRRATGHPRRPGWLLAGLASSRRRRVRVVSSCVSLPHYVMAFWRSCSDRKKRTQSKQQAKRIDALNSLIPHCLQRTCTRSTYSILDGLHTHLCPPSVDSCLPCDCRFFHNRLSFVVVVIFTYMCRLVIHLPPLFDWML